MQVGAVELEGVKLEDAVQSESGPLVLNGAGVRSIAFFKMYAVGLYLSEKQHSSAAVLADAKPKRIALHVLVGEGDLERFLNGFRKGIERNHSEAQLAALHERMAAFEKLFGAIKKVKRGDVIAFDWLPVTGTHVILNGTELGQIAGEDFYRALLSIWLGDKPVKEDVKKALLG
jgi:hypothetical protein